MFLRFTNLDNSLADDFLRLHRAMDDLFGDTAEGGAIRSLPRGAFPALNVVQTPDELQVYAFAPGIDPKSLDVSVHQGLLRISGKRSFSRPKNSVFYRRERFEGQFDRTLNLSDDIDPERISASYRDGILQIRVPRRESAKPRHISIQ